jgi:hypothetical protein
MQVLGLPGWLVAGIVLGLPGWLVAGIVLGLPGWLVAGIVLGLVFTAMAVVAFVFGPRLFPGPETDRDRGGAADERRRQEIRGYLRYVGEQFAEDHVVAGQRVAFYLPERDVAVTFDPRTYFRLESSAVQAVLVEHELPGAALGSRLPFETPPPTADRSGVAGESASVAGESASVAGDSPEAEGTAAAFARLGLTTGADVEAVRAAYRERVKAVHPDHGGDPERFQQLREAYAVASEAAS